MASGCPVDLCDFIAPGVPSGNAFAGEEIDPRNVAEQRDDPLPEDRRLRYVDRAFGRPAGG